MRLAAHHLGEGIALAEDAAVALAPCAAPASAPRASCAAGRPACVGRSPAPGRSRATNSAQITLLTICSSGLSPAVKSMISRPSQTNDSAIIGRSVSSLTCSSSSQRAVWSSWLCSGYSRVAIVPLRASRPVVNRVLVAHHCRPTARAGDRPQALAVAAHRPSSRPTGVVACSGEPAAGEVCRWPSSDSAWPSSARAAATSPTRSL